MSTRKGPRPHGGTSMDRLRVSDHGTSTAQTGGSLTTLGSVWPAWRVPEHGGTSKARLESLASCWDQYDQPGGSQAVTGPVQSAWKVTDYAGISTTSLKDPSPCWDQYSPPRGLQRGQYSQPGGPMTMLGPVWPAWRVADYCWDHYGQPGGSWDPVPLPRNPLGISPHPHHGGGVTSPMALTIKPSLCCHRHQ